MVDENKAEAATVTICKICSAVDSIIIITKVIGGVTRQYYKCTECGFQWPVGS